jgi:hypothetical protein
MKKHSILGLSARTILRWRQQSGAQNRRKGPLTAPADKLSAGTGAAEFLECKESPPHARAI